MKYIIEDKDGIKIGEFSHRKDAEAALIKYVEHGRIVEVKE